MTHKNLNKYINEQTNKETGCCFFLANLLIISERKKKKERKLVLCFLCGCIFVDIIRWCFFNQFEELFIGFSWRTKMIELLRFPNIAVGYDFHDSASVFNLELPPSDSF